MRGALIVISSLGLVATLFWLPAAPPLWVVGFWCLVVLVGLLVERYRYKPIETATEGAGWLRTGERFLDPDSGSPVDVLYHPGTGERRYVHGVGDDRSHIRPAART